jgi:hypothetical protein
VLVDLVTLAGMAGRVRVREISDDEGNRLKRIVRRGSGSVVTWRRAQMVLWSAQGMSVAQIAGLAFTSEDRVRDVLHNFNADGFESLYPCYAGGRPASNAEIAYTPTNSSWMNRLECQFTALREFTLNGTDHATHREQGSMIRRYIAWRNRHTSDPRLRRIVKRANVA